jgi:hypothetical protein
MVGAICGQVNESRGVGSSSRGQWLINICNAQNPTRGRTGGAHLRERMIIHLTKGTGLDNILQCRELPISFLWSTRFLLG